jgi:hypothetical protein
VVVLRQPFTWNEIESEDYPTYITNLRDIGCPESTIRDIILAEVNQWFTRRKAIEVVTADQQWWRSDPDPKVVKAAQEKLDALEHERRELLNQLLGSGWERADLMETSSSGLIPLNGPILGSLSTETRLAVQEIGVRAQKRIQDYLDEQVKAGKPIDPKEYARLRQQTRDELARVLNPEQLEEYLLRNSLTANRIRNDFRGLNLTADEFRQIFRVRDGIDQQMQQLASVTDSASLKRRLELERQRDQIAKQTLGPERYQQYQLLQDPIYIQARATAENLGVPKDAVLPLYQVNKARDVERQRIRNDLLLTPEQRADALQRLQEEHAKVLETLLGEDTYRKYLDSLE